MPAQSTFLNAQAPLLALTPLVVGWSLLWWPAGGTPPTTPPIAERSAEQDSPGEGSHPGELALDARQLGSIVENRQFPPERRLEAAQALLGRPGEDSVQEIARLLQVDAPDADSGARVVLRALERVSVAPGELWAPLSVLAGSADPTLRAQVARAAGSFRTREAAAMLVELAERDPEPPVRGAARESLRRLTGRDLPDEPGVWDAWIRRQGGVDGIGWLRGLIEGLAQRADRLSSRLDRAESQLVASYRRLHLALPPGERSALLASMLRDPIPRVRQLGFDLVDRELASASELGDDVGKAAIELLDAPEAGVRRQAALLVTRLAPSGSDRAIASRLGVETDAHVAEALLRGVARWPAPGLETPVARWASEPGPARRRAFNAAWSLLRAGLFQSESARASLRRALREPPPSELGPAALRLLVALGDEEDRQRVRSLLASEDQVVRQRAAEALTQDPGSVEALVHAAESDERLYDLAAQSLMTHRADAQGLQALLALKAPTPEQGALATQAMSERLELDQLAEACASISDAALRERLLARALGAPASPARARGVVALAGALVDLGRGEKAIEALDSIKRGDDQHPPAPGEVDTRAAALLSLGRVEQASALDATPEAWLWGLERSIGLAHARSVLDALEARYNGALTDEQSKRLDLLRSTLAEAESGDGRPATEASP